MKKLNVFLGAAVLAAGFTSCKSETETVAEKNVDRYVVFVDSIKGLDAAERSANWAAIDAEYERRMAEADAAIAEMKDNEEVRTRIETTKTTYTTIRTEAQSAASTSTGAGAAGSGTDGATAATGSGKATPMALFGNADTSFAWVNKDNILATYQKFVDNFTSNADNYTEDEFKQIKAWYETLDERKNTVEKEGLTGEDNRKIAALKVKFAPTFRWEKATADGPED